MTDDDIRRLVAQAVAESLALQPDEVRPDASLVDDLGADSLDFIDILFSLETTLGVKLRNADVDSFLRAEFSEDKLVDGRYVAPEHIAQLRQWLPALDRAPDAAAVTPAQVYGYVTVETFERIAQRALQGPAG